MASAIWGRRAIVAVIAVQIIVPTIALLNAPPTRFGFQMFSGLGKVDVTVLDSGGRTVIPRWDTFMTGTPRPEIDWTQRLPERLCAEMSDAHKVTVKQSGRTRSLTCR